MPISPFLCVNSLIFASDLDCLISFDIIGFFIILLCSFFQLTFLPLILICIVLTWFRTASSFLIPISFLITFQFISAFSFAHSRSTFLLSITGVLKITTIFLILFALIKILYFISVFDHITALFFAFSSIRCEPAI